MRGHPSLPRCAGTVPAARPCRCAGRSARQPHSFLHCSRCCGTPDLARQTLALCQPPSTWMDRAAIHCCCTRGQHRRGLAPTPPTEQGAAPSGRTSALQKGGEGWVCNSFCESVTILKILVKKAIISMIVAPRPLALGFTHASGSVAAGTHTPWLATILSDTNRHAH